MPAIGNQPVIVRLANTEDIPALASVLLETTLETTWDRLRFGAIDRQEWYHHLKEGLSESLIHSQPPSVAVAAVDPDSNGIVGFVELEKMNVAKPGANSIDPQAEGPSRPKPKGFNIEPIQAYYDVMIKVRERAVGDKPYTHVADLEVLASHRRRGIGTLLMERAMEMAKQDGEMLYFEATPSGVPLYERLGFRNFESFEIDLEPYGEKGRYQEVAMLWKP